MDESIQPLEVYDGAVTSRLLGDREEVRVEAWSGRVDHPLEGLLGEESLNFVEKNLSLGRVPGQLNWNWRRCQWWRQNER